MAPPYAADATGEGSAASSPAGTNGFAVASLVLGIVWIMGHGSMLALALGYIAKRQIDSSGGAQTGRGMAVAGIVLGWVGIALLLAMIVMMVVGISMPWGEGGMMRHDGGMMGGEGGH